MTNVEIANASKVMLGSNEILAMYIGDTLIYKKLLPLGYTQLEYIESTSSGGLYIDLNIKLYETLNTQYDIAIKFNITGPGKDNTQSFLFLCLNVTSPWPGTFIRLSDNSNNNVTGRYIGANVKDNNLGTKNSIIELPVRTSPNKNVYNLANSGKTHSFGTSLFCGYSDVNKTPYRFCAAKLYYFKLFVEGVLIRDMVPCKDSNNVVGLYDVVNNVFYTSPNGAAFVAGPEV